MAGRCGAPRAGTRPTEGGLTQQVRKARAFWRKGGGHPRARCGHGDAPRAAPCPRAGGRHCNPRRISPARSPCRERPRAVLLCRLSDTAGSHGLSGCGAQRANVMQTSGKSNARRVIPRRRPARGYPRGKCAQRAPSGTAASCGADYTCRRKSSCAVWARDTSALR